MKAPIIKYKTFNSSEDFEKWQQENNVGIYNTVPVPINLDMHSTGDQSSGEIKFMIFVTYSDRPNE